LKRDPKRWTRAVAGIKGVSEETTTGVHRLYQMMEAGDLMFPAINVNDSVTKFEIRQHLRLPALRHRRAQSGHGRDDCREAGRGLRLRRSRQGMRAGIGAARAPASWSRKSTPSARCRRPWKVFEVRRLESVVARADIFVTATGNKNIITADHMGQMKHNAIVSNIGHFDNEIDMAGLKKVPGIRTVNIKPQYDEWTFPDGHSVLILAEGRLMNLGCATGHPSFVMSASFTNQVLAQLALWQNRGEYEKRVYVLPKKLDEEVAAFIWPTSVWS